ncbi:MAG: FAD-binding protein [Deltaproteobacteria bacterium]|nr:FAD-binding protein [Deltaproteobacteria bacterium]
MEKHGSKGNILDTDVLCVGGGISGLMAAIHASELGARVIVAEKGNTLRSGSGGVGNDHFGAYLPEVHGPDPERFIRSKKKMMTRRGDSFVRSLVEKSTDIVKLWESWGISFKYRGAYDCGGHGIPGLPNTHLHYNGLNQKSVLTKEALKRGVEIINRSMVFELITNGGVIGAIAADTRKGDLLGIRAKSVFLGTGRCMRLYPGPTPGWMFNLDFPPSLTGDGRAMAFRAGAELVDMEFFRRRAGLKYFARSGGGTWVGVLRDPQGKPVGPFLSKPEKRYGDPVRRMPEVFQDYIQQGKGPIYMDCRGISEDAYEYFFHWLEQEGNVGTINELKEEGIDLRKDPVEFTIYEIDSMGGLYYNQKGETSLKGLYAAGDEYPGPVMVGAATFGWIAGESAARYSQALGSPHKEEREKIEAVIREKERLIADIKGREDGPSWEEVNIALQQIMYDYAGEIRSEALLDAGLTYVQRLRNKAYSTMVAENAHELMHCLEVLNLIDLGEAVFVAAKERKETRGTHRRSDYPITNPLMEKMLFVKKIGDNIVTEWREFES